MVSKFEINRPGTDETKQRYRQTVMRDKGNVVALAIEGGEKSKSPSARCDSPGNSMIPFL